MHIYLEKKFWYGQLSGLLELVAGVLGALIVTIFTPILHYTLDFVARAMIFVVIEDVIPECQREGNIDIVAMVAIGGYCDDDIDVAWG